MPSRLEFVLDHVEQQPVQPLHQRQAFEVVGDEGPFRRRPDILDDGHAVLRSDLAERIRRKSRRSG
jgi:hypothetical protein